MFPNATEVVWAQEEPQNMGAWSYVAPRIVTSLTMAERMCETLRPQYVGRDAAASPAVGLKKLHDREQAAVVAKALNLK